MKKLLLVFSFSVAIILNISPMGCSNSTDDSSDQGPITPADSPEIPARGYFKGYTSVLPPDGDFSNAYSVAAQYGEFVSIWGTGATGAVWTLDDELSGAWGQEHLEGYVRGNGMFPIIQMSFIDKDSTGLILKLPEGMESAALENPEWRNAYKHAALDAVKASHPLYFSPANEVNRWFEQYGATYGDPNGFQHFVTLYEEIYDSVKALSPETLVFPVFAREIVNEYREANLGCLEMFDPGKLDILVFTTYAFAVGGINAVSDIPDDYYSRALGHIGVPDKPFGFTEVAWSTLVPFGGEVGQADFLLDIVSRLTLDQGVNLHMVGWFPLFDLDDDPHQVGLIDQNGREKPSYEVWKGL